MISKSQRTVIERCRELTLGTHWIKSRYRAWFNRDGLEIQNTFYLNDSVEFKECWCLTGMINHVCGVSPSVGSKMHSSYTDRNDLLALVWDTIKELHPRTKAETIEDWNDQKTRKRSERSGCVRPLAIVGVLRASCGPWFRAAIPASARLPDGQLARCSCSLRPVQE